MPVGVSLSQVPYNAACAPGLPCCYTTNSMEGGENVIIIFMTSEVCSQF